jgi:hypothetical protein
MKNNSIIPISFVPGSGGRFLNYILNSTKETTSLDAYEIDMEHMYNLVVAFGNMKLQSQSMLVSEQDQLNDLINYAIDCNSDDIEYCSCHVLDTSILLNNFEKAIQISYEESDIPDISLSFVADDISDDITTVVGATANNNMNYISNFKTNIDNISLLRVTWKELYKDNVNNLITKLSNFLNVSIDKFKVNEILEWRKQTYNNIEHVKTLLGNDANKIIVWKQEGNRHYRNKLLSLTKYNTGD